MAAIYVRVRLGGEQYALAVEHVAEVVELEHVTPVPGAPASLPGVCNLRGEVVSVIDLAAVLGLPRDRRPERMLVTTDGGRRAGLAIDEVLDVAPLPDTSSAHGIRYITATAVVDEALLGVLDLPALLDAVELGQV
jgi:purine-binding chemotaxis protein CheW